MCHSIHAIKYLNKYLTKGHDRARATVREEGGQAVIDEIQDFLDARCITPPEACWRILGNILHKQSHTVYKLSVHLPDGQRIFFNDGQEELTPLNEDARQINEKILQRMQGEMVTLKSIDSIKANPGEDDQNSNSARQKELRK